ncbi:MAG: hypothetical protein IKU07_05740 [Oscillospiraceae bacterium]|nr:hypothetical protein [Oscillospiraceae bacterium]
MKRFLSLLIAVFMVFTMLPAVSFAAETRTVYWDAVGGNDANSGLTESAPVQTVEAAYAALEGADEGNIVLLNTVTFTAQADFPACDIPVTITAKNSSHGFSTGSHIYFGGDTTLDNMTLTLTKTSNAIYLSGEGNDLTIGKNITTKSTDGSSRFCLSTHKTAGDNGSATLTVKAGNWRNIFVGGHTGENTGNATLNMSGGNVNNLVGPTFSGKLTGNTTMNISGGTINVLMSGANEAGWVKGNVDINLTGGTISKVRLRRVINSKVIPIYGTVTVTVDGDCSKVSKILDETSGGSIDKTVLVLKSGTLATTPTAIFNETRVEIPAGKTMTLNGVTIDATSVNSQGKLIFSGAAALVADSITGTLNCEIADETKENHPYVTAPASSDVVFPAESGVVGQNGTWQQAGAFDTENFVGLVLKTTVPDISVKFFQNYNTSDDKLITPVYTENTEDGGTTYYYEVKANNRYYLISKPVSGLNRYNDHYNLYFTAEEAATKTVMDVTPGVRSTNGWDPSGEIRHRTSEVIDNVYPSDASLWPQYSEIFTTPAFTIKRNLNMQTTQTEMEDFIAGLDDENDNMYVYTLGQSAGKAFDIPLVIFTSIDLSGAETLEEAAALIRADSAKNNKLTVQHQAQIHGNEPAAGEAALGMLKRLDGQYGEGLLDTMNIYVIPRLNPYGAYKSIRYVYYNGSNSTDPNRDFMNLNSAETQARMVAFNLFDPEVVLDSHEYQESLTSTSHKRKDLMLCTHYLPNSSEEFTETALDLAYSAFDQITEDGLYYSWYSDSVGGIGANTGSSNTAFRHALHVLMETSGINQGLLQYERRVATHVSALTGIYAYLDENASQVKESVRAEQSRIVELGKTYGDDVVILDGTTTDVKELNIQGKNVNLYNGTLTDAVYPAYAPTTIKRSRVAPTAYVIPAGESYTDKVLALADKHGISYTYIPEGAALMLQQYTGTVELADLAEEKLTYFVKGAYVFTMNQVDAYILGCLMEPDVNDTAENKGTLAQQGIITPTNGLFPIYRYIHDLNENDFVDYEVVEVIPVDVTVYLDSANGADTNDGFTEATAVKTLEQAHAVLTAKLAVTPEGINAKIVLLSNYTLPAEKVILPAHSYPVEITAKSASHGLVYPGGSSESTSVVLMGGDTTLTNMTVTLQGDQSNNFLGAAGYKLVIGRGVTCVANSKGVYFSLCGGGYNGTYNSVDVTVLSGSWGALNLANFASGTVKGDAYLKIDGAHFTGSIRSSYKNAAINGDVYMDLQNITGTGSIYGGASNNGKNYGNMTVRLGENISKTNVYACGSNSAMGKSFTVIADGVDLTKVNIRGRSATSDGVTQYLPCTLIINKGELSDVIDTFVCREDATVILGCDQTVAAAANKSFNLDLNGFDAIVDAAEGATVTVWDSQTDDYTVEDEYGYGVLTATGNVVAKEGYIAAAGGFHKFGGQYISSVSLRPGNAGIYYTATFLADEVLLASLETGVAVSLADMPGADFASDEDTLYTVGTTGVMVENILTGDSEDADRAIMDIYAASYVKLSDGTVLVSENEIAYSLYDILTILQTQDEAAFRSFVETYNIAFWF